MPERDLQDTVFAEMAMRGTAPRQTWVAGVAFERSTLDARDQPQFSYGYNVPGLFAQDDIEVNRWLTLSASARLDVHNVFGTFLSPRISALLRKGAWTTRASVGVRQTKWDPLVRPQQAADGRWTVDGWAPLDGRVINGGVRIAF